jgi:hypothetical protein
MTFPASGFVASQAQKEGATFFFGPDFLGIFLEGWRFDNRMHKVIIRQ